MFHRTWWTRRRKVLGGIVLLLVLAYGVWVSGTHELHVGQSLDEANAVLWRAGARDCSNSCGMFSQKGGFQGEMERFYYQFPNGDTLYIAVGRNDQAQPFRILYFIRYRGWYKSGESLAEKYPQEQSVTLHRSVFAFLPGWEYIAGAFR